MLKSDGNTETQITARMEDTTTMEEDTVIIEEAARREERDAVRQVQLAVRESRIKSSTRNSARRDQDRLQGSQMDSSYIFREIFYYLFGLNILREESCAGPLEVFYCNLADAIKILYQGSVRR